MGQPAAQPPAQSAAQPNDVQKTMQSADNDVQKTMQSNDNGIDKSGTGAGPSQSHQPHDIFRSIMGALAGPKYTYNLNADTGKMERTQVQQTKSQLANSIVAGALTGLFAGAGQRGPGAGARGLAAGGQAGMAHAKEIDQSQQQRAKDDFARQASITKNNLDLYTNQLKANKLGMEHQQSMVDMYTSLHTALQSINGVQDYATASELPSKLAQYHVTKDGAIPIGIVPKIGDDGMPLMQNGVEQYEFKYAIIDPSKVVDFPQDVKDLLAKYKVQGYVDKDGKMLNLPKDYQERAYRIIAGINEVAGYKNMQKDLDGYATGKSATKTEVVGAGAAKPATEIKKTNFTLPTNITDATQTAATKYDVPVSLVNAVLHTESKGNPNALSPKGAQGLMQLMPATAKKYGVTDAFDPAQNIDAGTHLLSDLLKAYKGDTTKAIAAYNAGEPAVNKAGGVPNYPETKKYVNDVHNKAGMPTEQQQQDQKESGELPQPTMKPVDVMDAAGSGRITKADVGVYNRLPGGMNGFLDGKGNEPSSIDKMLDQQAKSGKVTFDPQSGNRLKSLLQSPDGKLQGQSFINDYREKLRLAELHNTEQTKADAAVGKTERLKEQSREDTIRNNDDLITQLSGVDKNGNKVPGGPSMVDLKHVTSLRNEASRQALEQEAHKRNPDFNPEEVESKVRLFENFAGSGRSNTTSQGAAIKNANTSLGHMAGALTALDKLKASSGIDLNSSEYSNKTMAWLNDKFGTNTDWNAFKVAMQTASTDWQNLLNNQHALTDDARKMAAQVSQDTSPWQNVYSSIQEMAHTAAVRIVPLNEEWKQSFNEDFHNLIYPDTVKAIQKINNPYVNELLGNMKSGGSITGSASGAGKGGKTVNELTGKTQAPSVELPNDLPDPKTIQGNALYKNGALIAVKNPQTGQWAHPNDLGVGATK
jgi:hypothetical protein